MNTNLAMFTLIYGGSLEMKCPVSDTKSTLSFIIRNRWTWIWQCFIKGAV